MIDFRYHLVSLISVFLALAVGIVLGAGPLKDQLGTKLTESVEVLRQQKEALHAEVATANTALDHRDEFITSVTPSLVGSELTGDSVVIVTLPEVDDKAVSSLSDAITAAGGKVTGQIGIKTGWIDPEKAADRDKVAGDLVADLPTGTVPVTGDTDVRLANLLSGALVSPGAAAIGGASTASANVLDALQSADLIGIEGKVSGLAGGAMVLAPANPVGTTVAAPPSDDAMAAFISLATSLDTVGGGTVVTGPASSATDGGVLTAIRKDKSVKSNVSTVDGGSTPPGVITAILAMREQFAGATGSYGFGDGADAVKPAVAGSVPSASPTATKK